jgi:hypothetical protein
VDQIQGGPGMNTETIRKDGLAFTDVIEKPKPETANLFEFLGEDLIRKLEERPIQIEIHFADGSRTFEITKKDRWYKQLKQRRDQQIEALRTRLRTKLAKT